MRNCQSIISSSSCPKHVCCPLFKLVANVRERGEQERRGRNNNNKMFQSILIQDVAPLGSRPCSLAWASCCQRCLAFYPPSYTYRLGVSMGRVAGLPCSCHFGSSHFGLSTWWLPARFVFKPSLPHLQAGGVGDSGMFLASPTAQIYVFTKRSATVLSYHTPPDLGAPVF